MTLSTYDKLAVLAKTSPQFEQIRDFMVKLRGVKDKQTCILLCRAEMPKIGDSIRQIFGDIPFVTGMKQVPIMPDAVVMRTLETLVDALRDGIETTWKRVENQR